MSLTFLVHIRTTLSVHQGWKKKMVLHQSLLSTGLGNTDGPHLYCAQRMRPPTEMVTSKVKVRKHQYQRADPQGCQLGGQIEEQPVKELEKIFLKIKKKETNVTENDFMMVILILKASS